jgi:hypothetical protein
VIAARLPVFIPRAAPTLTAALPQLASADAPRAAAAAPQPPVDDRLPQSQVKPEFANSGRWIGDPAR